MRRERVTQRELADHIGVSQGHLSKVLRGQTERDTRVLAALTAWGGGDDSTQEAKLIDAARDLVDGEPRGMQLLMRLMQILRELRRTSPRRRSTARARESDLLHSSLRRRRGRRRRSAATD